MGTRHEVELFMKALEAFIDAKMDDHAKVSSPYANLGKDTKKVIDETREALKFTAFDLAYVDPRLFESGKY